MLRNSFCHLPGVGLLTEQRLWQAGIHNWDDFQNADALPFGDQRRQALLDCLAISREQLDKGRMQFFCETLPTSQHWRLFADCRSSAAFLDIETSGLSVDGSDHITSIALYDGQEIFTYVHGDNLRDFPLDIQAYELLISFNGKSFDLPFIERYFLMQLPQAHIDLRYVMRGLGYRGGLKAIEKTLGIERDELEGVDGYLAVLLWRDYVANNNPRALETLLAYNVADSVNLENLLVFAWNAHLQALPFGHEQLIPLPARPKIPWQADLATVERLVSRGAYFFE